MQPSRLGERTTKPNERCVAGGSPQNGPHQQDSGGARRQTILASVLESLRLYLPTFTLTNVIAEIERWWKEGRSCFTKLLEKLKIASPQHSILDQLLPHPGG